MATDLSSYSVKERE